VHNRSGLYPLQNPSVCDILQLIVYSRRYFNRAKLILAQNGDALVLLLTCFKQEESILKCGPHPQLRRDPCLGSVGGHSEHARAVAVPIACPPPLALSANKGVRAAPCDSLFASVEISWIRAKSVGVMIVSWNGRTERIFH
jgi:hypothetical protein